MAISVTLLDSGSLGLSTSHTTASITPGSGLITIGVRSAVASGTPAVPTSVSGCGLTFDLVGSRVSGTVLVALYRAMGTPTTGQITITFAAAQSLRYWVAEASGVASGSNGASAVRNVVTGITPGTGTTLSVPFGAFADVANGALAVIESSTTNVFTPRTGWTEFYDDGAALEGQWRSDNDTAFGATYTNGGGTVMGVGSELVAATEDIVAGAGTSDGTSSVAGAGAGVVSATGASDGTSSAAALGAVVVGAAGASAGSSAVAGVGNFTTEEVVVDVVGGGFAWFGPPDVTEIRGARATSRGTSRSRALGVGVFAAGGRAGRVSHADGAAATVSAAGGDSSGRNAAQATSSRYVAARAQSRGKSRASGVGVRALSPAEIDRIDRRARLAAILRADMRRWLDV